MGRRLKRVLSEGAEFRYEYDFGSTTALSMAVVEAGVPALSGKRSKVAVLARNDAVTFLCSRCGSGAVYVCGKCGLWDGGAHCYRCALRHGCGMETCCLRRSPRGPACAPTTERSQTAGLGTGRTPAVAADGSPVTAGTGLPAPAENRMWDPESRSPPSRRGQTSHAG